MIKKKKYRQTRQNKDRDIHDDGRTIANMNVDGMPWTNKDVGIGSKRKKRRLPVQHEEKSESFDSPLTRQETRRLVASSIVAALIIGLVFVICMGLFILFAVQVWLR